MRQSARPSRTQNSRAPRAFLPSLQRCLVLFGTGAILGGLLTPVLGVGIADYQLGELCLCHRLALDGRVERHLHDQVHRHLGIKRRFWNGHLRRPHGRCRDGLPATASDYVITDSTHSSGSGTVTATPTLSNSNATTTFKVPKAITAGERPLCRRLGGDESRDGERLGDPRGVDLGQHDRCHLSFLRHHQRRRRLGDDDGLTDDRHRRCDDDADLYLRRRGRWTLLGRHGDHRPIWLDGSVRGSGHAGYTTASTGTVSVASQVITVSGVSLTSGSTLTVTYGSGGGANSVTVPETAGAQSFSTSEKSTSSGTLTALSSSPSVTVSVSADGSGTMTVSPSVATESVGTTLTFTYTAATGDLYAGAVTITAPNRLERPFDHVRSRRLHDGLYGQRQRREPGDHRLRRHPCRRVHHDARLRLGRWLERGHRTIHEL